MTQSFETHGVLSCCTGKLMGDIGSLYEVMSYLLGRSAYTHELAYYGEAAATALKAVHPELPSKEDFEHVNRDNFEAVRDEWIARLGPNFELSGTLKDVLADDRRAP